MGLPNVNIIQGNGNLGAVLPSQDGIAAMVLTGIAPDGYTLGDVLVFTSLANAEAAGFDAAYDTDNSLVVHEHIKNFYQYAGNGMELHFMLVAQSVKLSELVDRTQAYAKKLLSGLKGHVKLLSAAVNPDGAYVPSYDNGLDTEVETAIVNAQALVVEEKAEFRPVSIIIEGRGFQGTPSSVVDLRQSAANRVSVALLAKPEVSALAHAEDYAAVGVVLGKAAGVPVQRNIGRVKDGALGGTWGLSGNVSVDNLTKSQLDTLHDKGFIFAYQMPGANGYIINDDPTCSPLTDDYSSLARGRVMDKATRLVRQVYVNELKDEVDIDAETGRMSPSQIKYFQALAEDSLNGNMAAAEEIAGANVSVDPTQDVLTTDKVSVKVKIVPRGYAKALEAELDYENPNS